MLRRIYVVYLVWIIYSADENCRIEIKQRNVYNYTVRVILVVVGQCGVSDRGQCAGGRLGGRVGGWAEGAIFAGSEWKDSQRMRRIDKKSARPYYPHENKTSIRWEETSRAKVLIYETRCSLMYRWLHIGGRRQCHARYTPLLGADGARRRKHHLCYKMAPIKAEACAWFRQNATSAANVGVHLGSLLTLIVSIPLWALSVGTATQNTSSRHSKLM